MLKLLRFYLQKSYKRCCYGFLKTAIFSMLNVTCPGKWQLFYKQKTINKRRLLNVFKKG